MFIRGVKLLSAVTNNEISLGMLYEICQNFDNHPSKKKPSFNVHDIDMNGKHFTRSIGRIHNIRLSLTPNDDCIVGDLVLRDENFKYIEFKRMTCCKIAKSNIFPHQLWLKSVRFY